MKKYLNASVKDVLEWAEKQNFSSFQSQNVIRSKNSSPNYQITEIKELENDNLKDYLHQRGLSSKVYPLLKEIHFTIGEKKLYAIGFQNNSEGWELRNSFYKGALFNKDISLINFNIEKEQSKSVGVFEGFTDALSFVEMQKSYKGNILVLNSISLIQKAKEYLKNYSEINLFLDNDTAGIKSKQEILKSFPSAKDYSGVYSGFKDLNEFLIQKIKNEATAKNELEPKQQNSFQEKNKELQSEQVSSFKRKR